MLCQMAATQRIPHALIFLGKEGSGNLPLALAFAQMLQCTDLQADGQACGTCNACGKAQQYIHPDIHYSYPTIGAKAVSTEYLKQWRAALQNTPYLDAKSWLTTLGPENKQGNITAQECMAIVRKLSLKSFEGKYKVLILWLPEYLAKEGNRLLKLIEEPPENTIFILVAEDGEKILNTILSRCQTIKMDPLADESVTEALQNTKHIEQSRAQQIAFLADGNYAEALRLIEHEANDQAALFLDWLRKCYMGKATDLVPWVDAFAKMGREQQKQFLLYGLHFLRELLVLVSTGNTALRLSPQESNTAQKMAKVLDFSKISEISERLNANHYHIERNGNPKPIFLNTSIQVHRIMTRRTVAAAT